VLYFQFPMKVSVIMPVFNCETFLGEALESILRQSYSNFEVIVVDDCSTDGTRFILESYQEKDTRIKVFRNRRNLGVGASLNRAISQASGTYLARADADDVMDPARIVTELEFLDAHQGVVAVGSWTKVIDTKGKIIGVRKMPLTHRKIAEMMFYAMGIQNPTVMFNRKLIPKNFSWCKETGFVDDLDLLFRLLPYGKFANIKKFLVRYRMHKNSLSLRNTKATFREAQEIRERAVREFGYRPTLKALAANRAENVLMRFIPEKAVVPVYNLFRNLTS